MKASAPRRVKSADPLSSDSETRARDDHHDSLRLWLRLLTCSTLIESHIRKRLHSEFSITLARFDFMAQLERCPAGLKMNELSNRLMVTGSNVTGMADVLEKLELIARVPDPEDRRAFRIKLTRAGRKVFKQMAATHEAWVIDLFKGSPRKDRVRLAQLLQDLKLHIRQRIAS